MKQILTYIGDEPIYRNFIEDLPYTPELKKLLPGKRKAGILAEVLFWYQVRAGNFHRIDFDRQRIIGNYIVDFYVKTLGLIVEIDTQVSNDIYKPDTKAEQYLESLGLKMFRISETDIKNNMVMIMKNLEVFIIENYGNHPVKN
ncbi:DUF559 domain-containing protein [Kaistella palustris]|uniref:DUF559 domain-containing protein n=1 Tax=Kaistella palustris TaxID=493376 RepID=UPI000684385A|nr:DUF559 domain-containing protein [Kaistella palustris]